MTAPEAGDGRSVGTTRRQRVTRAMILALFLGAAWLLWSGLYKPLLLALGAGSCLLTLWLVRRMGFFDDDTFAFRYDGRILGFWGWLFLEIVRSSLQVARVVLRPRLVVDPKIVTLEAGDLELVDQALLGNSITLAPGTLTIDAHDGRLLVHALTADGARAIEGGEMKRRISTLRRR